MDIFKFKDFSIEKQKNSIFKLVHECYFTKTKAFIKILNEIESNKKPKNENKKYTITIQIDMVE